MNGTIESVVESLVAKAQPGPSPRRTATDKNTEAADDSLASRLEAGLEEARAKAKELEDGLARGRAADGERWLSTVDELLTTYLLLMGLAAARGSVGEAERLARQAATMMDRAPEAAAAARKGLELATETDPAARTEGMKRLGQQVALIAMKARALAAQGEHVARRAPREDDTGPLFRHTRRVREAADALEGSLAGDRDDSADRAEAVAQRLREAAAADALTAADIDRLLREHGVDKQGGGGPRIVSEEV